MPRAPRKWVIEELPGERYRVTTVIQSTARRPREFDDSTAVMSHIWQVLTLVEDTVYLEFKPLSVTSSNA